MTAFACPPPPAMSLSLDTILGVGFGVVYVMRDNVVVWQGDSWTKKLRSVERQARREPGRWTVRFYSPLIETTYERRGRDTWVLIAQGEGFA